VRGFRDLMRDAIVKEENKIKKDRCIEEATIKGKGGILYKQEEKKGPKFARTSPQTLDGGIN